MVASSLVASLLDGESAWWRGDWIPYPAVVTDVLELKLFDNSSMA